MIKATLVGDDKLKAFIESRYPLIQSRIGTSMARLVIQLTKKVKQEKLSGQVLNNRTGTLRRSISPNVITSGDKVTGEVGTNVEYAAPHEFGFHGTVNVKAHIRYLRERGRFSLRAVKDRQMKVWKKVRGKETGESVMVKAHSRYMNLPERSFLRSALREMEPEIRAEFEKVLISVVKP